MGPCSSTNSSKTAKGLFLKKFKFESNLFTTDFGIIIRAIDTRDVSYCTVDQKKKSYLVSNHQTNLAINEMDMLTKFHHPNIMELKYALQDQENLYLVLEQMKSRLSFYLFKKRRFSEIESKYIIASIIVALEYLHSENIMHRDLRPENIFFTSNGHVKLYGFHFAKVNDPKIDNSRDNVGKQPYMAPEIYSKIAHGPLVDFFALGVIIYQMIFLTKPAIYSQEDGVNSINSLYVNKEDVPNDWSQDVADFVTKLLKVDPNERLGSKGVQELKSHSWFAGYDWKKQQLNTATPIFVPIDTDIENEASEPNIEKKFIANRSVSKETLKGLFFGYEYGFPKFDNDEMDNMV